MELIQSKDELNVFKGMVYGEGFKIYSRILTSEIQDEYNKMMQSNATTESIRNCRDKILGLKYALEIGADMIKTYEGKYDD